MAPTRSVTAASNVAPLPLHSFTPETFQPFGRVLADPGSSVPHLTVNQSTARKHPAISAVSATYPSTSPAAAININLFVCSPRQLTKDGIFNIEILERHPYTSQSFIPLGAGPDAEYVVVCAPTGSDGGPDVKGLRAFRVRGDCGVTYGSGVWHAPMIVVDGGRWSGGQGIRFVVVNGENGTKDDLEECEIKGGMPVRVRSVGLWKTAKM